MGLKQCDKCGEMVDEAKAFCPGCGHAFVEEEKRQTASSFEKMDNTVQLGQTMYNQMLSDMGLNISKTPQPEKRIEVLEPAVSTVKPAENKTVKPKPASNTKWFILGGVLALLVIMIVLAAAVLLLVYWYDFR